MKTALGRMLCVTNNVFILSSAVLLVYPFIIIIPLRELLHSLSVLVDGGGDGGSDTIANTCHSQYQQHEKGHVRILLLLCYYT